MERNGSGDKANQLTPRAEQERCCLERARQNWRTPGANGEDRTALQRDKNKMLSCLTPGSGRCSGDAPTNSNSVQFRYRFPMPRQAQPCPSQTKLYLRTPSSARQGRLASGWLGLHQPRPTSNVDAHRHSGPIITAQAIKATEILPQHLAVASGRPRRQRYPHTLGASHDSERSFKVRPRGSATSLDAAISVEVRHALASGILNIHMHIRRSLSRESCASDSCGSGRRAWNIRAPAAFSRPARCGQRSLNIRATVPGQVNRRNTTRHACNLHVWDCKQSPASIRRFLQRLL